MGLSNKSILIYIAGHGVIDRLKRCCLLTSDSNEFEGLPFNDIFDLINRNSHPDNIVVILDCCHFGIKISPTRNNMFWITATSDDNNTNNQFHENLLNYLNNNSNLTIYGLLDYLHLHGHIEQPYASIQANKIFYITKIKNETSNTTEINNYFLRKRGRLRTAYPINISFHQIFDQGLYISPIIKNGEKEIKMDEYLTAYSTKKSYLILGNPGVGKSFLSFLLQKRLVDLKYTVISLSFQEMNDLLFKDDGLTDNENIQIKKIIKEATTNKSDRIVFLIDGLDEFVEWDNYTSFLGKIAENTGVIAFSREIEYENKISKYLPDTEFDEILKVKKWQYEQEFIHFLALLLDRQYINKDKYENILLNAKEFQEQLITPLHSRMYIYVYEDDSKSELSIINKGGLYSSYI